MTPIMTTDPNGSDAEDAAIGLDRTRGAPEKTNFEGLAIHTR
jgi:hypothetical protein